MCGVAGCLHLAGGPADPALVARMREALRHRGPDDGGAYAAGPIALGFRRLSIIDIPGGHQPMTDGATGRTLVFNGEIYNFRELRRELEGRGHRFRTRSDTEVLLRSLVEWGAGALPRLTGMFAFATWDPRDRSLLLARDRLGVKPLLWTRVGDELLFASEAKAFFEHPGFRREPDLDGVSSYLTFRQPVWDLTLLEGVHKVLPGQVVSVRDGEVSSSFYWRLPAGANGTRLSEGEYVERIESTLGAAVESCLISDVPFGAYLSGGLDSSIMVALMTRLHSGPVRTYSIGYDEPGYDEGGNAAEVARHLGTEHAHLVMRPQAFADAWPALVRSRDAPLSIPHEIPLYHLSREMKRTISVALSGDGADELFGGYGRVLRGALDWKKVHTARRVLGPGLAGRIAALPRLRDTPAGWLGCASQMEHFFRVYNWVPFDEKWALLTPDARSALDGDRRTVSVFEDAFAEAPHADPYERVLHVFQKIHLGCLLEKLDAMAMAASVEGRVPFVDHRLVELGIGMPIELKLRWNSPLSRLRGLFTTGADASERLDTTKVALRRVGERLLPAPVAYRRKLGFPTPLDAWLDGGMLDLAREILLDPVTDTRGIFDRQALRRLLDTRQELPYDFYGKKVWMLANVELWLREVVDQGRFACSATTSSTSAISSSTEALDPDW